jgi:hypothetical protein
MEHLLAVVKRMIDEKWQEVEAKDATIHHALIIYLTNSYRGMITCLAITNNLSIVLGSERSTHTSRNQPRARGKPTPRVISPSARSESNTALKSKLKPNRLPDNRDTVLERALLSD